MGWITVPSIGSFPLKGMYVHKDVVYHIITSIDTLNMQGMWSYMASGPQEKPSGDSLYAQEGIMFLLSLKQWSLFYVFDRFLWWKISSLDLGCCFCSLLYWMCVFSIYPVLCASWLLHCVCLHLCSQWPALSIKYLPSSSSSFLQSTLWVKSCHWSCTK